MKIRINIFLVCMVLASVSCSDFLAEKQTTAISSTSYETEEMLESNILGIVQQFSGTWAYSGEPAEFFSIASGLTHWGGTSRLKKPKWDSTLEFTQYSTTEVNNNFFRSIYKGIECCNHLLAALPKSPVDEAYKLEIEAEARFYRAVLYFTAVRIWGDLPLRLEPVNVTNSTYCPRSPYYTVYETIVRDFEYAQKYMRLPARAKSISPQVPRPNRYAATAYLSSVYVTIGSLLAHPNDNFWDKSIPERIPDFSALEIGTAQDAYTKALTCAESIIRESATFDNECTYELANKFGDLFNYDPNASMCSTSLGTPYDAWNNPEQIFVLTYSPMAKVGSYMANRTLPHNPAGTLQTGETSSNNGRWRPNRWVFWKWCETYPGRDSTISFKGKKVSMHITSSDPRVEKTLYYGKIDNIRSQQETIIYPNMLNTKVGSKDECLTVLPYFKKYWSTSYNNNTGDASFYQMRYAEVYLNAAEAAAYLGLDKKAYDYIEVIHARARRSVEEGQAQSEQPKWKSGAFANKEDMLTAIFWERIFELYGEGHEWNETHRNGAQWIVDNIVNPKNEFLDRDEQSAIVDETNSALYPKGFRYSTNPIEIQKALLAGFPYNEILYNKGISDEDQNDFIIQ